MRQKILMENGQQKTINKVNFVNNIMRKKIILGEGKKVYFASDQHFGMPNFRESKIREERFVHWLDQIKSNAQVLFLMGDLFDFWHEWDFVVPKGYIRVLGKIAELKDLGIDIYFFVGNHDLWMKGYFEEELGIPIFFEKQYFEINGKQFLLAHGDGLGPGDKGYKRMKKLFIDYFVFGHRHLPMMLDLNGTSAKYINLGDWISYFTYGVFEKEFELKTFD